uniref:Uncharacterized protein n=1 Tax=Arundo donax TaxID=35708 RepID=A0A0A9D3L7_ARUDO
MVSGNKVEPTKYSRYALVLYAISLMVGLSGSWWNFLYNQVNLIKPHSCSPFPGHSPK